jgi:hypothetical protein
MIHLKITKAGQYPLSLVDGMEALAVQDEIRLVETDQEHLEEAEDSVEAEETVVDFWINRQEVIEMALQE